MCTQQIWSLVISYFSRFGDIVPSNARVLRFQKIATMTCWAKRSVDCVHGFLIYYAWTVSCGQGTRCTLRLYPQRYAQPGQLKEGIMVAGCFCFSLILAALGSLRLCFLRIASRGTVALEDLASTDVMLFNLTGTITCNKPCFFRDKIELFANSVDKDQAIILAARASRSQHEFCIESIDAAILSLLDDPEQARAGIEVLEHHARFFVALKLMFLTTYIDSNGSKCCVFKGDPAKASHSVKNA
uniref:Uncharacterized protein n=1 Tax=Aegilops tauschii subsp. strangulata TaxID=200361 RepID=A0A453J8B8_AEGTS